MVEWGRIAEIRLVKCWQLLKLFNMYLGVTQFLLLLCVWKREHAESKSFEKLKNMRAEIKTSIEALENKIEDAVAERQAIENMGVILNLLGDGDINKFTSHWSSLNPCPARL